MEPIDILQSELEELQKKYWNCFNNWHCDEDLDKLSCRIEELKYKISLETLVLVTAKQEASVVEKNLVL